MNAPLIFTWTDDGTMRPHDRFAKLADREFCIGQDYRMEVREERSLQSHSHYFASLSEAWSNLPEHEAERFPTSEHLRKWCLIKTGFADERSIVCASKAEAQRLGAFIRPMDDYAVVTVSEAVVTVYTAKSQSLKAMGKKDFQRSKEAVLEIAWALVGLSASDAEQHVGKAA